MTSLFQRRVQKIPPGGPGNSRSNSLGSIQIVLRKPFATCDCPGAGGGLPICFCITIAAMASHNALVDRHMLSSFTFLEIFCKTHNLY